MGTSNQTITFKGDGVTVVGKCIAVGEQAPDFTLTGNDLSDVTLSNFEGKVLVISSVPSLDTPVCQAQTKRFNEEVTKLNDSVVVLTVSVDLPFAQKRFCGAEGIENVQTASDYKHRTFGENYGTYIQELGLLARAVFVVGKDGTVAYVDYVSEITEEPDYEAAIEQVKASC